ncbi:LOW QUALITY PROTEIN: hypothetical protein ACHAXT_002450 [Thalassiosira profunda]
MAAMPPSRISHRAAGGPDLNYLYATSRDECDDDASPAPKANKKQSTSKRPVARGRKSDQRALRGTTLYLGGEEGPNQKIYCIPGHAERVLCIDTRTDEVYPVGPQFDASNTILQGKFKWLRGIVIGDIIYGLPCHADCVLRIDTATDEVSTIHIPYEEYFDNATPAEGDATKSRAHQERHCPWKYHGGAVSPHDGCIYAIPQSSRKVLRIDPKTERCSFVGPDFEGRCKWYGGVVGKTDGAIYAIPQNAEGVLRIDASGVQYSGDVAHDNNGFAPDSPEARVVVTTHGSYPLGGHKWHGAAASADGTIVSVPNNVDTALRIVPALEAAYHTPDRKAQTIPEPELYVLEGQASGDIATGRHRDDNKYKYLGAMAGTDGHVYCFPSGSERVLQVDTVKRIARSVGPNLRDEGMERLFQNKWQNGLTHEEEGCVYAIPLAAETILRIRTSGNEDNSDPEVTTWKLPLPNKTLEKWEGGVIASNRIMYCMPNNHKAVLQIVPPCVPSRKALHQENDRKEKERERARELQKQERQLEREKKQAEKERKRQQRIERKKNEKKGGEAAGLAAEEEKKEDDATGSQRKASTKAVLPKATPDGVPFKYTTGIPTLRSSAHRVKYSLGHRKHDPKPKVGDGTAFLPPELCEEDVLPYNADEYDFHGAVVALLQKCDKELIGTFRGLADGTVLAPRLDNFVVPVKSLTRKCQRGKVDKAQRYLSDAIASDAQFLDLFDRFLVDVVLPHFKRRLERAGHDSEQPITFYYQRPPTLRLQPGPARSQVRAHNDAEYGHQNGELNFWLPLTSRSKTARSEHGFSASERAATQKERGRERKRVVIEGKRTRTERRQSYKPSDGRRGERAGRPTPVGSISSSQWATVKPYAAFRKQGDLRFRFKYRWFKMKQKKTRRMRALLTSLKWTSDYHPLKADLGEVVAFHGSSCKHYVNSNHSLWTRASLDFRVGVQESGYDPDWQMLGTTNDHTRRKVTL